jgi:hypothetical protein
MQLYYNHNNQDQVTNCAAFETFMRRFEWVKFFQPNPEKAPWHVQCNIKSEHGEPLILNFWPHKLKGQYDGKSVEGMEELRRIMAQAIEDSTSDFSLIED